MCSYRTLLTKCSQLLSSHVSGCVCVCITREANAKAESAWDRCAEGRR